MVSTNQKYLKLKEKLEQTQQKMAKLQQEQFLELGTRLADHNFDDTHMLDQLFSQYNKLGKKLDTPVETASDIELMMESIVYLLDNVKNDHDENGNSKFVTKFTNLYHQSRDLVLKERNDRKAKAKSNRQKKQVQQNVTTESKASADTKNDTMMGRSIDQQGQAQTDQSLDQTSNQAFNPRELG